AGRGTLDVAGLRRNEGAPWTGTAAADWRRQVGVDAVGLTAKASTDAGDHLTTRSTVRRTLAGETTADVQELTLVTKDSGAWQLTRPATLRVAGSTIAVDRLELTSGTQRIVVAGRAGSTGPADATLEWHGIDLATVCRLSGAPKCQGRADGNVRLT